MSVETLTIDKWDGDMTIFNFGDINSGRGYVQTNSGANPFVKPGQLTWNNATVQIDPNGSVITDLILDGKERAESGILYVYAIGHTGKLYKIQVNDPNTYDPDYDNPTLLTTLSSGSPTFTRGGFIEFFGATEQIYIGHDMGVTKVNFDGSGETVVSGTWAQAIPRPFQEFLGKLYVGNGTNIAEIDSTGTVTSSTRLSPGFPTNTQVRDIDASPDGNYLQMVVTRLPLFDITSSSQETISTGSAESYAFKWNGIDTGYTTFDTYPSFSLGANIMFQNFQYLFGYDQYGSAVFDASQKLYSSPESPSPLPNAVSSNGNLVTYMIPLYYLGVLEADYIVWGNYDFEVGQPVGYWDMFFLNATPPETDIIRVPFQMSVSNVGIGASSNNYVSNIFGTSKIYFSTLETSSGPTTAYRFYKWSPVVSPDIPSGGALIDAIYQTQTQMFSKKVTIKEVRVYGEPWVAGNAFDIYLFGSTAETVMDNGTYSFVAGTNLTIGDDFAWWNPDVAPTYAIGLGVSNQGEVNHVINKVEIDYSIGGK